MKSLQEKTSTDLSLSLGELRIHNLLKQWCDLLLYATKTKCNAKLVETIAYHVARYSIRLVQGDYHEHTVEKLENQQWYPINDRYGYRSIYGTLNEYKLMVVLAQRSFIIEPAMDKQSQVQQGIDFWINTARWKDRVSCQSKSVTENADGTFSVSQRTLDIWCNVNAQRLYIVGKDHALWCNPLLLKDTIDHYPDTFACGINMLTLETLYEMMRSHIRDKSSHYGLIEVSNEIFTDK